MKYSTVFEIANNCRYFHILTEVTEDGGVKLVATQSNGDGRRLRRDESDSLGYSPKIVEKSSSMVTQAKLQTSLVTNPPDQCLLVSLPNEVL